MTKVVVVMGSVPSRAGLSGLSEEPSKLQKILRDSDAPSVTVISLGIGWTIDGLAQQVNVGAAKEPLLDRLSRMVGLYALRHRLSQFPIGRLLNSMGHLDQGKVFWRRVRRDRAALALLTSSDIAVAADPAGVKTCWLALRRGWVGEAYYDHRAAGLGVAFAVAESRD